MASDKYTSRTAEDKEVVRQLEIRALEKIIQDTPDDQLEEHKMVVGNRTFTLQQILEEAKEGSEIGELFIAMQSKSRLEQLRRK